MKYKVNSLNPFPHLKTADGHGPQVTIVIDWSTRSIDSSNLAIEVQIHQINWPPKDIFRWKLLK